MAEAVDIATERWREVFNGGPYSSFTMANAIMHKLELSYRDALTSPRALRAFSPQTVTREDLFQPPFLTTWFDSTGRCTSFALKVAYHLEVEHPSLYSFEYFGIGKHRVAHCKNTGVLIDSSSTSGATVLNESDEWTELKGLTGHWKYIDNKLIYERDEHIRTATSITAEKALAVCLKEVVNKPILVCLFRNISDNGITFSCLIQWQIAHKCVELIPDLKEKATKGLITFSREGTPETLEQCVTKFKGFIEEWGDMNQWKVDDHEEIHTPLWSAAVDLWGFPQWSET
ncbi:hypothetical protein F4821DRAFT_276814 [Hypoxylon rubiginosum]|uniref:Uncharacterized protein n=1 Tax=Hypoxylon rubiginosum TaxID=110542 RepID=A0ACC0DKD6_9PEZI|nr:hypothetical protein F4821DRAFT_276814 [Hypoxylon rubiginosum]